jgi:hypothetical protein
VCCHGRGDPQGLPRHSSSRKAALTKTAIGYLPMQDPASFNLDAVKKQIDDMIRNRGGQ